MAVGRRERKKQATRAALSEAAVRLSLEHGVENVTVEQIADAADVSLRTFFNYFSSKEEAVVAGDSARAEMLVEEFLSRPASEDPLTALQAAVLVFVDDVVSGDRREALQMMRRSPALLPHQLAAYAAAERALAEAVAERVGEEVPAADDEGSERPVGLYPALVAAVTMAGVRVAVQRWSDTGSRDLAALHEVVGEVFDHLGALRAREH
ncbi:TetR/AcrR family transcriptional regulator [Actinomycetospora sp. TBRC 11914]|uniref:TetR/AcrR family transcriptional regulator n=1 Tax=Actinomycetospora sp. TBRC 11914 TaxID=2729387 RepID=UPI00145F3F69|nr:TetR/AcrR family transcriptional regulator [Actinomycetospora sp. TBRC 11914]NMO93247.1 TetR family transcriptional regulator [Actinomycetospora sp. TBRC 11914]